MAIGGFINSAMQYGQHGYGEARHQARMLNDRLGRHTLGRAVQKGVMESFGWHYSGQGPFMGLFAEQQNYGFLGLKGTRAGRAFTQARKHGVSVIGSSRGALKSLSREAKTLGWSKSGMAVGRRVFDTLPGLFTAYSAYQGYQEGGVFGAVKGAATSVAMNVASSVAFRAVGIGASPLAIGALAIGAGYGAYKLGEAGREFGHRMRHLEMGAEVVDRYGSISTMRQRSLMALQNTHVNGRMALGNEASLLHLR